MLENIQTVPLLAGTVLVVLGALRLTLFITQDTLGFWLIRGPLEAWGRRHEDRLMQWAANAYIEQLEGETGGEPLEPSVADLDKATRLLENRPSGEPQSWQARLVSGLACPWCVGFWVSLAVTVISILIWTGPAPYWLEFSWTALLATLGCSYLVGVLSGLSSD